MSPNRVPKNSQLYLNRRRIPAQETEDDRNNSDNQQDMYQTAGCVSKSPDSPPNDQDNGYDVQ